AGPARALEVLPAIVACGVSFAGMQFFVSNFLGPELTDIVSSLTCIVVMVALLRLWRPKTVMRLEGDHPATAGPKKHSGREIFVAWMPYLLLVVKPSKAVQIYKATFKQLSFAMVTIATMLGLAYLMNYSGMTSTLGLALAASGGAFPFFSAVVGWLGVFLTGSDTSANALFGN